MVIAPTQRSPRRIPLSVPHFTGGSLEFIREALAGEWTSTTNLHLEWLEKEFSELIGLPSVALVNGTAAIHLGLKLLGIKPGLEVVSPTLTFVASCNPILYEHARPVLIDSERQSWNMDPQLLADFLKKRATVNKLPGAVIIVHLFGQSADMDPIVSLCRRYETPFLEDAAGSLGARYKDKPVGTFGDVGIYSFNVNKVITCTGGGMLVSPRAEWVERARHWSRQSCEPGTDYLHFEVGYNYRLSNVLAGIAREQLGVLSERISQRRAVAFRYRDAFADLPGIELMPQAAYGFHTNWLSCFLIDEARFGLTRVELVQVLDAANVASRPVWKPMHTQKLFRSYERIGGAVAEDLNRRGICLPSSSSLTEEDQQFVIERVREAHFQWRAR